VLRVLPISPSHQSRDRERGSRKDQGGPRTDSDRGSAQRISSRRGLQRRRPDRRSTLLSVGDAEGASVSSTGAAAGIARKAAKLRLHARRLRVGGGDVPASSRRLGGGRFVSDGPAQPDGAVWYFAYGSNMSPAIFLE